MNSNELHGTLVLVHPGLENDPAGQQGKVGILTYVDAKNEIFVSFKNAEGKYSPNALLQLKDRAILFPGLMNEASTLEVKDFKDPYKISVLQDTGQSTDIWEALEIAGSNPAIWEKALKPIESSIPRRMEQFVGR